ncbi:hypothetical protein BD779DRAFT_1469253 [Infundibulicybe gibba]|nr:hypothetical protein BD779DRAFT_1469253 [Infundibulicybe gibba]
MVEMPPYHFRPQTYLTRGAFHQQCGAQDYPDLVMLHKPPDDTYSSHSREKSQQRAPGLWPRPYASDDKEAEEFTPSIRATQATRRSHILAHFGSESYTEKKLPPALSHMVSMWIRPRRDTNTVSTDKLVTFGPATQLSRYYPFSWDSTRNSNGNATGESQVSTEIDAIHPECEVMNAHGETDIQLPILMSHARYAGIKPGPGISANPCGYRPT